MNDTLGERDAKSASKMDANLGNSFLYVFLILAIIVIKREVFVREFRANLLIRTFYQQIAACDHPNRFSDISSITWYGSLLNLRDKCEIRDERFSKNNIYPGDLGKENNFLSGETGVFLQSQLCRMNYCDPGRLQKIRAAAEDYARFNLHITLGDIFFLHQKLDQAYQEWRFVLDIDDSIDRMLDAAGYYIGIRNISRAEDTFEAAVAANPDRSKTYYRIALQRVDYAGLDDEVKRLLEQGLEIDSRENPTYFEMEGLYYLWFGDSVNAIGSFERVMEQNQDNFWFLLYYGQALEKVGDLTQARDVFRQAKSLDPAQRTVYLELHEVYANLGMHQNARTELQAWLEISPLDVNVHLLLANLYTDLGQYQSAVTEYEIVLSLEPENAIAKDDLSMIQLILLEAK